jgi:hypothetical protein
LMTVLVAFLSLQAGEITVGSASELRAALSSAKPGTTILLSPGTYDGGLHFANVHGTEKSPILIRGKSDLNPPRFLGGGSALQFSDISHVTISNIVIEKATHNGINIDDGGSFESPSHHVRLHGLQVRDLPAGNHDGIKLSGVTDFRIDHCTVERWGGSGIDMVGCHRGFIVDCTFRKGGDNAVQAKGGTAQVAVWKSRFEDFGQRGVNIGGSTGFNYFRPPLMQMPEGSRFEASGIAVEGCVFSGGIAPIAFVGVKGAVVRFNTIYHPQRWAFRILQETRDPSFLPSQGGLIENNLIVFKSDQWLEGGVNIGPGTAPNEFRFEGNFWYCSDRSEQSTPKLPTREIDGVTGIDPRLKDPEKGDFSVGPDSPASKVGAHAYARP